LNTENNKDFPVEHLSASSMALFSSNPLMFRITYINRDRIETTTNASMVLGKAFHHAIDMFFKVDDKDPIKIGLEEGLQFIEEYPEGFIKWSKTIPDKQTMKTKFSIAYNDRVKQLKKDKSFIDSERVMEHDVDVEWNGKRVSLPIRLKGVTDRIYRDEKGRIVIEDDKVCYSFSDPDKIDGKKILQAIQYYFLVYAEFSEEPYKMTFVETKYTGEANKGDRTVSYDIIYSENTLFFDFYLRFYSDTVKALMGEQVFLPNVDTLFDNEISIIAYTQRLDLPEEKAKQEKKYKVDNITDILKKDVSLMKNMRTLQKSVERSLAEYKNIDYSKMQNHEKIGTKFMEYGIILKYDSSIVGNTFTQHRFTPSIGVKMKSLNSYCADLEQTLGISGVRIVAPIPDTSFIGIEVPNKERTFTSLESIKIGNEKDGIPIGIGINGDILRLTLDEMPHMLVAGTTGSGKSVFINTVIRSILSQHDLQSLYLIDPKLVELSEFVEEATSIAYTPKDSIIMLNGIATTMDKRYKEMQKKGCKKYSDAGMRKIVCVIDEFADLMLQSREKDKGTSIENLIVRIAQKGRAAGIHLIIATQRPDSDIITGLIKANFPTKVAFATSSEINSRIIIDESGAEKLKGKGDALVYNPKFTGLQRIQAFNI